MSTSGDRVMSENIIPINSRLPIKRWDRRKHIASLRSSEPKTTERKRVSNLARLNTRIKPKSFDIKFMQEKLSTALRSNCNTCKYHGIYQLMDAVQNGHLFEGQLIFEKVDITCHKNSLRNIYKGWIWKSFDSVSSHAHDLKGTFENSYYIHVGVYVGKYKNKHYVVDAGGRDSFIPMVFGTVGIRGFCNAFNLKSNFYTISSKNDDQSIFNLKVILQRALAGVGTKYIYHCTSLTSELFCNVLLGSITYDTFNSIMQNFIQPNSSKPSSENKNLDLDSAKYFYNELTAQIRLLRPGIHLSLGCYLNRIQKSEKPWFRQMIRSYVDLMSCIKVNDVEKCGAIINTGLILLSSYNVHGETPLTLAAKEGRTNICALLVDFVLGAHVKMALGGDVNLPDANGNTALLQAFLHHHFDTCDVLLNLGANGDDSRFQSALFDCYKKWESQSKFQEFMDIIHQFKDIIDIEVFYNSSMLEAIKEGHRNEFIQHMDNLF